MFCGLGPCLKEYYSQLTNNNNNNNNPNEEEEENSIQPYKIKATKLNKQKQLLKQSLVHIIHNNVVEESRKLVFLYKYSDIWNIHIYIPIELNILPIHSLSLIFKGMSTKSESFNITDINNKINLNNNKKFGIINCNFIKTNYFIKYTITYKHKQTSRVRGHYTIWLQLMNKEKQLLIAEIKVYNTEFYPGYYPLNIPVYLPYYSTLFKQFKRINTIHTEDLIKGINYWVKINKMTEPQLKLQKGLFLEEFSDSTIKEYPLKDPWFLFFYIYFKNKQNNKSLKFLFNKMMRKVNSSDEMMNIVFNKMFKMVEYIFKNKLIIIKEDLGVIFKEICLMMTKYSEHFDDSWINTLYYYFSLIKGKTIIKKNSLFKAGFVKETKFMDIVIIFR
ncbi:hypothetical protein ABK040_004204 [Willaertia magna]